MTTSCFIVREKGSMKRPVIEPLTQIGMIIGVSRLHPFMNCRCLLQ